METFGQPDDSGKVTVFMRSGVRWRVRYQSRLYWSLLKNGGTAKYRLSHNGP